LTSLFLKIWQAMPTMLPGQLFSSSNSGDNDDDTKVVAKAETTQQRQQCHNDDTMATVATAVTETVGTTMT